MKKYTTKINIFLMIIMVMLGFFKAKGQTVNYKSNKRTYEIEIKKEIIKYFDKYHNPPRSINISHQKVNFYLSPMELERNELYIFKYGYFFKEVPYKAKEVIYSVHLGQLLPRHIKDITLYKKVKVIVDIKEYKLDYDSYKKKMIKVVRMDNVRYEDLWVFDGNSLVYNEPKMPKFDLEYWDGEKIKIKIPPQYGHTRNSNNTQYTWIRKDETKIFDTDTYEETIEIDQKDRELKLKTLVDKPKFHYAREYLSKNFNLKYIVENIPTQLPYKLIRDCDSLIFETTNLTELKKFHDEKLFSKFNVTENSYPVYQFEIRDENNTLYTSGEFKSYDIKKYSKFSVDKKILKTDNLKLYLQRKQEDQKFEDLSKIEFINNVNLTPKNLKIDERQNLTFCSDREAYFNIKVLGENINDNTEFNFYRDGVETLYGKGITVEGRGKNTKLIFNKKITKEDEGYYYFKAVNKTGTYSCDNFSDSIYIKVINTPKGKSFDFFTLTAEGTEKKLQSEVPVSEVVKMKWEFEDGVYYSLYHEDKEVYYGQNNEFSKVFQMTDAGKWKVYSYVEDKNHNNTSCISDNLEYEVNIETCEDEGTNLTTNIPTNDISFKNASIIKNSNVIFNFDMAGCPYCAFNIKLYPLGNKNKEVIETPNNDGELSYTYNEEDTFSPYVELYSNGIFIKTIDLDYSITVEKPDFGTINMWLADANGNKIGEITEGKTIEKNSIVIFEFEKASIFKDDTWEKVLYPLGETNQTQKFLFNEKNQNINSTPYKTMAYLFSKSGSYTPYVVLTNKETNNIYPPVYGKTITVTETKTQRTIYNNDELSSLEIKNRLISNNNTNLNLIVNSNINEKLMLSIFNATGNIMFNSEYAINADEEKNINLNVSNYAKGTYFVVYKWVNQKKQENTFIEKVN